jgi:aerobic carbon-monoxide dehydrogenase medium subunit
MYDFEFLSPQSVAEAVAMLRDHEESKLLAGGQTFIPVLKQRLSRPSYVIDLSGAGLAGISVQSDRIAIGAMTTHATVALHAVIGERIPGINSLASWIGDRQVRHRGTIGGSLANNDPTACYPSAVLALDATIRTDRRTISADDFFDGLFTTALEPDEIIEAVEFPIPEKSNYAKFRHPASRYAMVGVFVAKTASGVRVAITGASNNGVFRHRAMELALSRDWSPDAVTGIETPSDDLNDDHHGSAAYRAHLVNVMTRRAVAGAS